MSLITFIRENLPFVLNIFEGAKFTLIIALTSGFFGVILGTMIALLKSAKWKWVRTMANIYTDVLRGTPVILQLSMVHFVIFGMVNIPPLYSAIVALSFNSAAYLAEVIRAGIQNIDKGQIEAAEALGVSKKYVMLDIILPQAFRNTIPPIINELAALVKESSIVYIIGVADIMFEANRTIAKTFLYFEPLLVASICYYVLVKLIITFGKRLEVKFNVYTNKKPQQNI